MDMNAISDAVMSVISTLHARTYIWEPPQIPVYPYVFCRLDSSMAVGPSDDVYLIIDIIDSPNVSVRAMQTIADTVQNALDDRVMINQDLNLHAVLEQRQYISNQDLITDQRVNLRFVCRVYFI